MNIKPYILALLSVLMLLVPGAYAAKLKPQNLKQLISASESILSGQVQSVTDGISPQGLPFTEVTIKVNSAAKGKHAKDSTYTFRQFGLTEPRMLENGNKMLAVSPEGFPRWHANETVIVFMHEAASLTGLRTTAGMAHGKFTVQGGKVSNEFGNYGIFDNLEFADGALSESENRMLSVAGAYNAADFMSLVGKAVSEQWISNGKMK
ncbi:hypothetical protein L2750_01445 [Shewanella submarina]|uniref:Uncharacterized protein n=1 Tax=Shewanella submarina TaxID=2016376 RepID=A0ABV7GKC3_9GAMM|nr:hypothetical protein [Shewanella submarina]MCL1035823.1 hypothetical protein [Shewanella submarina]